MLVSIVLSMTSTILVKNNKNSWEIGLISLLMTSMLVMAVYPLMDTLCLLSSNYMLDSMSLLMIVLSMWITSLMLLASYKLKNST